MYSLLAGQRIEVTHSYLVEGSLINPDRERKMILFVHDMRPEYKILVETCTDFGRMDSLVIN